jgi:glycine oxidase
MLDYIIVGCGLAGISFAETALKNKKTIHVFDACFQSATAVAGGLYNPVILKRFSEVWQAQVQLTEMENFFSTLEKNLDTKLLVEMPILRKFYSIEEQNNWFLAADKPNLKSFIDTKLITKKINGIESPFGFGRVLQTGFVDTALLLKLYKAYLQKKQFYTQAIFDYNALIQCDNHIEYLDLKAKNIVFAEGFGMHQNPYFKNLPLDGTKGELLIIKAPDLKLDEIINTSIFVLPLGDDLYKVGATYNWIDKTTTTTAAGKQELLEKIQELMQCDFTVIAELAGIRPTVKDRRPLIGTHADYPNFHILNGLGTRGVMLGPTMAKILFNHIEFQIPLDKSIDIARFYKK